MILTLIFVWFFCGSVACAIAIHSIMTDNEEKFPDYVEFASAMALLFFGGFLSLVSVLATSANEYLKSKESKPNSFLGRIVDK